MNATYLRQVDAVSKQPARNGCSRGVAFDSDAVRVSVYDVPPGASIAPHRHTVNWDVFFGVAGRGAVTAGEGDDATTHEIVPGALCAMPPGTVHTVTNDADALFTFMLVQTPYDQYDFVPATEKASH